MFLVHLLYAAGVAVMSFAGLVTHTGITAFRDFDLIAIPAFVFIRALYIEVTRPVQQVNVDFPTSDFMSTIPTAPVIVTSLIVRPPSLVPSVIVRTTTDLAVIPTTCKALLVLETLKPIMSRAEEEREEHVCEWPSATPITLLEFTSAFEAPSLPPTALDAAPSSEPTTTPSKSTQPSALRSTFTPYFTLIVASAIICASVSYVLSPPHPGQRDHSVPSVASQHEHVSVREPQDSLVTVEDQNTPSNDEPEPEPEAEAMEAAEIIEEQADNKEEIEEPNTQDAPQVQTLEIQVDLEVTGDPADGTEDVEELLSHNETEPMEVLELEKVIGEQAVQVQETPNKNAPLVEVLEVEAAAIQDGDAPSNTLIAPSTPTAVPEAVDESGPSSGPKRRRGKRGGVRSETARRRRNAERAELRAYDLNVDGEDVEQDGEEDYPTPTPEAVDEPQAESGPSIGPKRRRGKRGGVRSETARRRRNAERAELRAYDLNADGEGDEEDY
ncbi:hypothetical protein EIP91_003695 [Steccherinum ochraceum]|uniref:Uncharacterized protein n=1 Tax=Steccherinum ochraceum TaxID=92696 RepID=A0A4R0S233_9APHY|nr:hypothetical protein EIP91_003695 [Steccherinum ochraceum]